MKTRRTLVDLATEIERQRDSRKDYIAPTRKIAIHPRETDISMSLVGIDIFDMNDLAHRQLGTHTNVPAAYYDRMRQKAPELLALNLNHWLEREPSERMVRTLDGRVRAFLSDSYRPLDNADLAEAVLPAIQDRGLELVSCEITERRLYIKAVDAKVVREIEGRRFIDGKSVDYDHVSPSLTISNSEVGAGALSVETGMFTHGCKNMALFRERSLRKYHAGAKHELTDGLVSMLSDKTRRLTDAATWAQVGDVVRAALNAEGFDKVLAGVRDMRDQKVTGDVVKAVDLTARAFSITDGEKKSVLKHLIEGGDLSRYGMFNAITRAAEDLDSYDRSTDFERMGGQIIDLPSNDWKVIAEAA